MSAGAHLPVNPDELGPASGFSHAMVAAAGRTIHVAGQIGCDATGAVVAAGLVAQFDVALRRLVVALAAAGAAPEDVVSMVLYTTAMTEYREQRREFGAVYRAHLGRHFPAMTMIGVSELVESGALIEVSAVAVVREPTPAAG